MCGVWHCKSSGQIDHPSRDKKQFCCAWCYAAAITVKFNHSFGLVYCWISVVVTAAAAPYAEQ